MIAPTHRRPKGLDAELDALVAREVDALALRKPRTPNGKTAHDQVEEDQAVAEPPMQDEEGPRDDVAAPASHPHDVVARGRRRRSAATNVIGIRHGNLSGGLNGIPFSADEEAFIEEAVAFLRRRANADVILDEIWTHAVVSRDEDAEQVLGEQAGGTQEPNDEATGSDEDALHDGAPAPERNRILPTPARRSAENVSEQSAGDDDAAPPAIHVVPPRSGKGPAAKEHGSEGSTP
jgi:hypothetical protein